MRLSECKHGILVITDNDELGMIVGVTYDMPLEECRGFSTKELINMVIPLVQFPEDTLGISPKHLSIFEG